MQARITTRVSWVQRLCAAAIACLAIGCGGGGGGGSPPPPALTFTADRTAVTFDYTQGQTPAPVPVTITASGSYTGNLYLGATETGTGIATPIAVSISGQTGTFTFAAAPGLAAGTYSGTVSLMACSDSACSHQVGNSPITISYTVTVRVPLAINPTSATLSDVSGTTTSQTVTVALPDGVSAFTATVLTGSEWLSVSNVTATSFDVAVASVKSGTYNGSVQVSAGGQLAVLPVLYEVSAPAGGDVLLAASPSSVTLAAVEDATGSSQMISVTPPSWNPAVTATVEYPTGSPQTWLTVTPVAGGFAATSSAAGITQGAYTANIRLSGAYPSQDVVIPVAFTVGVGFARPADVTVAVGAETTPAGLAGSAPVTLVAGTSETWTAASSAAWLVLTNPSGTTGTSLAFTIDPASVAGFANGSDTTAEVTVTPTKATMTPVSFAVTLHKQLPAVTSLAPYVHNAGVPVRVVVRGAGFNSVLNPLARFTVQGGTLTSASVVNDTEVVLNVGALAAGNHTVAASNALGMSAQSGHVTVVTPASYVYAAVPTGGALRSLAYDAERDAIYAANIGLESIMRFRHSGSSWASDSLLFAAAYDVGLTQDGAALIATASSQSSSTIAVVDPAAFTVGSSSQQSITLQPTFDTLGFTLPTTNDGRSWLAVAPAGSPFANLAYVTPTALTPTNVVPANLSTLFYGGPWFAMSRDGERLIIVQSASVSPQPPMLYLNAADGVLRTNPAGLTFSYHMSASETGDRVFFDNGTVRDGAFNLIGTATLPTGSGTYDAIASVISPDGTRAFVLAYNEAASGDATLKPRVFVFDASSAQAALPILGYFDLADYPGCVINVSAPTPCPTTVAPAISLDGQTLFFGGSQNLVVAPVPAVLTPAAVAPVPTVRATPRTTPWPLSVR